MTYSPRCAAGIRRQVLGRGSFIRCRRGQLGYSMLTTATSPTLRRQEAGSAASSTPALAHEVLPLVEALVDDGHTAEDNAWCRLTRIGNMLTALTCGKCQLLARL